MRKLTASEILCVCGGVRASDAAELSPFQTQLHNTQVESELFEDVSPNSMTPIDNFGLPDSRAD